MSHVSMTVYQKLCNCKSIIHRRHWIADSCRVQTVSDSPWLSATENLLLVERRTLSAVVSESLVLHYGWCVQTVIKMCPLWGVWGDQQPTFYFGTPSISPKLIELGSWNLAQICCCWHTGRHLQVLGLHDFSMTSFIFHDFPGLENGLTKFHDQGTPCTVQNRTYQLVT